MESSMPGLIAHPFHPLGLHPTTEEPIIRLPHPHENIIITPQRSTDIEAVMAIMNDPAVYPWLLTPPYPYLREHAERFVSLNIKQQSMLNTEVDRVSGSGDGSRLVSSTPVRSIREVREDGTEVYIGDVHIAIARWGHVEKSQQLTLATENLARPLGHPDKIWEIVDFLASSHHGKGIMTAAVGALINQWVIPRMGVHTIRSTTFKDNKGSFRVFEKNGFVWIDTVENCSQIQESKGGGIADVNVLLWTRPT